MKIKLISCIGTDSNISNPNLLYHFIEHYSNLGITNWSLTLHSSGNLELNNLDIYKNILDDYNIPYKTWIGKYDDVRRVVTNNILIARQNPEDWLIGADFDEFIDFPDTIPEYLANLEQQGYNCVTGELIDYIGVDGELSEILPNQPLQKQFPIEFDVRKDSGVLWEYSKYAQIFREKKIALKKPLQWWIGRHQINQKTQQFVQESPNRLKIRHYPWDHLRLKRVDDIYQSSSGQKPIFYDQEQYLNTQHNRFEVVKYLKKHGKFNLINTSNRD